MTREEAMELMTEYECLLATGFEDALLGVAFQFSTAFAVYDRDKAIRILIERDGMTEDEAVEYFEFNVQGAYVGPQTPAFIQLLEAA